MTFDRAHVMHVVRGVARARHSCNIPSAEDIFDIDGSSILSSIINS